jgi:hypothetical protein
MLKNRVQPLNKVTGPRLRLERSEQSEDESLGLNVSRDERVTTPAPKDQEVIR